MEALSDYSGGFDRSESLMAKLEVIEQIEEHSLERVLKRVLPGEWFDIFEMKFAHVTFKQSQVSANNLWFFQILTLCRLVGL